jgi:hypothetical protein
LLTLATPDLVILTVTSKPYQWSTPKAENVPQSRSFHSAAIVGNFMITAFGCITGTQNVSNSLSILDISDNANFHWTSYNIFQESQADVEFGVKQTFLSQNLAAIIGGTIGGVVVIAVIVVIVVLLYKSWKSHSNMRGRQQLPSSSQNS